MEENGIPFYFACDFSPRAVNFVKVMKFEFVLKAMKLERYSDLYKDLYE